MKVILISHNELTFEKQVNEALENLHPWQIIDIKYSTSVLNDKIEYSALIIYKLH